MDITCIGFLVFFSCSIPEKPPTDSFCAIYSPRYMRHSWPRDAKEAIDPLNRAWKRVCRAASQ